MRNPYILIEEDEESLHSNWRGYDHIIIGNGKCYKKYEQYENSSHFFLSLPHSLYGPKFSIFFPLPKNTFNI